MLKYYAHYGNHYRHHNPENIILTYKTDSYVV